MEEGHFAWKGIVGPSEGKKERQQQVAVTGKLTSERGYRECLCP